MPERLECSRCVRPTRLDRTVLASLGWNVGDEWLYCPWCVESIRLRGEAARLRVALDELSWSVVSGMTDRIADRLPQLRCALLASIADMEKVRDALRLEGLHGWADLLNASATDARAALADAPGEGEGEG